MTVLVIRCPTLLQDRRKMYQLDANSFIMILSHKWPLHVSDIYMSVFRSSYMLFRSSHTIAQLIRPHNTTTHSPTPHDTSGVYSLACNTCKLAYVGQTSRTLHLRYQEHTRYIKNNNPQSAYALHILHNRPMNETMTLLKPLRDTSLLMP